jgi:predicted nucleic acid-binding protein
VSYLLDVNALIAGVYEDHEHHAVMRAWLNANKGQSLRVAPLAMTGCLRVLMSVSGERKSNRLVKAIGAFKKHYEMETVSDNIELEQLGKWIEGPKQVTDAHLLAIAGKHGLKLVTFDKRMPRRGVLRLG